MKVAAASKKDAGKKEAGKKTEGLKKKVCMIF